MLLQLILVMLAAACIAGQLNHAIYRLAWTQRSISPWGPAPDGVPPRDWRDRIPVFGWWRLRREATVNGPGFWVRPALIELSFIVGLGLLYLFELDGGLLPIGTTTPSTTILRAQFLNHACLITMMLVATFIDLDEKTIPDEITVTGTLLAALLAGLVPTVALPVWIPAGQPLAIDALRLVTPGPWRASLNDWHGLGIASLCILGWWYALLPKTLWYRGGVLKFLRYLGASLLRHRLSPRLSGLAVLALIGTVVAWKQGAAVWQAVLSAWVGMAVAGTVVWLVRIVAGAALQQEAMGFGDVTLMGMIGAFLGWQPALLVFFLAPFTGVLIAVTQWLLTGRKDIAYGPFLCLAALIVVLGWGSVWESWGYPIFSLGSLVPLVLVVSLLLLGSLLWAIQRLKALLGRVS